MAPFVASPRGPRALWAGCPVTAAADDGGGAGPAPAPAPGLDAGPRDDPLHDLPSADGTHAATCRIINQRGLHARAAARFVKTVERFDAAVSVFSRGQEVSGHSIMGLMMLAAGPGSEVRIVCQGPQAAEVLAALESLIAGHFGEA